MRAPNLHPAAFFVLSSGVAAGQPRTGITVEVHGVRYDRSGCGGLPRNVALAGPTVLAVHDATRRRGLVRVGLTRLGTARAAPMRAGRFLSSHRERTSVWHRSHPPGDRCLSADDLRQATALTRRQRLPAAWLSRTKMGDFAGSAAPVLDLERRRRPQPYAPLRALSGRKQLLRANLYASRLRAPARLVRAPGSPASFRAAAAARCVTARPALGRLRRDR